MTTQELFKLANDARPDLIEQSAEMMKELEDIEPLFVSEVTAQFDLISDVTTEKIASVGDAAKTFGTLMAGSALAGLGSALATDIYDASRRGLTKGRNWKRIMEANPKLKREIDDPKRLSTSYSTLHRYAPEFTADPMMGGAILKAMANLPEGSEANFVSNLISSRKNLLDARNKQFSLDSHIGDALLDKGKGGGPKHLNPGTSPLGANGKPAA